MVAYLRATLEADRLIRENPEDLSEKLAQWTGIEPEVCYAFHGPWGIQTRDFTLKPEFIKAIRQAEITLRQLKRYVNQEGKFAAFLLKSSWSHLGQTHQSRFVERKDRPRCVRPDHADSRVLPARRSRSLGRR